MGYLPLTSSLQAPWLVLHGDRPRANRLNSMLKLAYLIDCDMSQPLAAINRALTLFVAARAVVQIGTENKPIAMSRSFAICCIRTLYPFPDCNAVTVCLKITTGFS